MALERGENDAAFFWLVAVVKEIAGHGASLTSQGHADIGAAP
jgi:hypothetical protein